MLVQRFEDNGLCPLRLKLLTQTIEADIARRRYHGAVILVARGGKVGLHQAIGHSHLPSGKKAKADDVFTLFSLSKAFTNLLTFRAIERGQFALTTRIVEIIPEFVGQVRERITFNHLLTHRTGIPTIFSPVEGMNLDVLDEMIAGIIQHVYPTEFPGQTVSYSPMVAHALMGEAVRRTDPAKRTFRQIAHEDLFEPLKMNSTAFGVRKDLKARHVPPVLLDTTPLQPHPSTGNLGRHGAFEEEKAEMPWVGAVSTAEDLFRFAEMLRRGGELDGARIVGPAILEQATRVRTGELVNNLYAQLAVTRGWEPYPAYIGLGFFLRGDALCPHQFGTLSSPRTFGNNGFGSTVFWVDPARDLTFVCLTAGVMTEGDNIERFQKLSDIAVSAAL